MSEAVGMQMGQAARERLLGGALLVVFLPALVALARVWSSTDYLSQGFLVPLAALWALHHGRPRRAGLAARPERSGAIPLVLALLLYVVGLATGEVSLEGVALVGAVAGAIWFLRGRHWLRALAFPVGFLLFMVPPPPAWIAPVIVALQLWVSQVAVLLVHLLHVPLLREGNVLTLASGESLFVAEACSGITSVITLAPLAVLLAWTSLRGNFGRVCLVASVVPLAMLGNLGRVVATVALADRMGVAAATAGGIHVVLGLSTYGVACAGLLGVGGLLRRLEGPA